MYHFVENVMGNEQSIENDSNILFWHTGGSLGMFDRDLDLSGMSPVERLDLYGKKK